MAALILGAVDVESVQSLSGLGAAPAGKALARLVDAGLVERGKDGTLVLLEQVFADGGAGRAPWRRAARRPTDRSTRPRWCCSRFVRDGRLLSIPAAHGKRLIVLGLLAQEFEPGRRYSEPMVNLILGRWHADTAALRRYLVDEGFLDRAGGEYWRSGGAVTV